MNSADGMVFYLGCHQPAWLERVDFPLFVSHRRLVKRLGPRARTPLPVATCRWALDSGAFSELAMFGEWRTTPREYLAAVRRYRTEIGNCVAVACQDWMCEPIVRAGGVAGRVRFAGTGLGVDEHQRRTVLNALTLLELDASVPWLVALQGWDVDEYERCADLYERAGIDLAARPLVGLGSVCKRAATPQIAVIVEAMARRGIKLHGFGVKSKGLENIGPLLASSDSMAWSFRGRRVTGCAPGHKTEANCLAFATRWRARMLARMPAHRQLTAGDASQPGGAS